MQTNGSTGSSQNLPKSDFSFSNYLGGTIVGSACTGIGLGALNSMFGGFFIPGAAFGASYRAAKNTTLYALSGTMAHPDASGEAHVASALVGTGVGLAAGYKVNQHLLPKYFPKHTSMPLRRCAGLVAGGAVAPLGFAALLGGGLILGGVGAAMISERR